VQGIGGDPCSAKKVAQGDRPEQWAEASGAPISWKSSAACQARACRGLHGRGRSARALDKLDRPLERLAGVVESGSLLGVTGGNFCQGSTLPLRFFDALARARLAPDGGAGRSAPSFVRAPAGSGPSRRAQPPQQGVVGKRGQHLVNSIPGCKDWWPSISTIGRASCAPGSIPAGLAPQLALSR